LCPFPRKTGSNLTCDHRWVGIRHGSLKLQIGEVGRALTRGRSVWRFPQCNCPARLSPARPHLFAQVSIAAFVSNRPND
jgi:hypothetical protein